MFKKLGILWISIPLLVLAFFAFVYFGITVVQWLSELSPLWLIAVVLIIVIFIGYLFRKKLPFDSISTYDYSFVRNPIVFFFAAAGAYFFFWYCVLDRDTGPTTQESKATTVAPYNAFAGMRMLDFGPLTTKSGESLQVQVLNGQGYWIHPVRPGTYIITVKDMRDLVLCKTKIVKVQGKSAQFISIIPPPADVVIESYKVTFDRGGDFIVSPDMAL